MGHLDAPIIENDITIRLSCQGNVLTPHVDAKLEVCASTQTYRVVSNAFEIRGNLRDLNIVKDDDGLESQRFLLRGIDLSVVFLQESSWRELSTHESLRHYCDDFKKLELVR